MKTLSLRTIQHSLGVSPATADRICGLIEGRINPDNVQGIEVWALESLSPPLQIAKVMQAICWCLRGDSVTTVNRPDDTTDHVVMLGDPDLPTLSYQERTKRFLIATVIELIEGRKT
jgi:hypothetical protein